MSKVKVFHIVTVAKSVPLMDGQIEYLNRKNKLDVHVVASSGKELSKYPKSKVHILDMEREIKIYKDIVSLIKMVILMLKERPYIVNSGTPKGGLLGMIGAFITRRPVRIYTVRGLRLETVQGLKYKILYLTEKIAMSCATDIISISESLKDKVIELGLAKEDKIKILGYGSSNGLNFEKYNLEDNKIDISIKRKIQNKFVLGFVGRITKDKGITELLETFKNVTKDHEDIVLLIIGSIETGDPISKEELNFIHNTQNIIHINHTTNPVCYYNNIDLLIFPTHREGFGNVSIEAQALKVPVVTFNVTGAKDTVINNKTGYIVEKGDIATLTNRVNHLIENPDIRKEFGKNGREWVMSTFSNEIIWKDLEKLYNDLLKNK